MLHAILSEQTLNGVILLRKHLQAAALNNLMGTLFGKRYDLTQCNPEAKELQEMVREGFEILGAFNWSDYLPGLNGFYGPFPINERCSILVPRVKNLVKKIVEEHRNESQKPSDCSDFVDVLLPLDGTDMLCENDTVAVLWEMIFCGTDTTVLLAEWVMAELVLNPDIQTKLHQELDRVVGDKTVTDADVAKSPYLQAVIKETPRVTHLVHFFPGQDFPRQMSISIMEWLSQPTQRPWSTCGP
ncbi:hypothetical protein SLA2020_159860 [Shorea laevis]